MPLSKSRSAMAKEDYQAWAKAILEDILKRHNYNEETGVLTGNWAIRTSEFYHLRGRLIHCRRTQIHEVTKIRSGYYQRKDVAATPNDQPQTKIDFIW